MAEFLHCSPEVIMILLISYIPIQIKILKILKCEAELTDFGNGLAMCMQVKK